MRDNFCRVIEQDTVGAIAQLVAETILGREVNELDHQLCLWLLCALGGKQLSLED